jgi:hypothetical protein
MPKYECTVLFDASTGVDVEADTPEAAAQAAEDEVEGRQHLCHQCSNSLDTGDSIGTLVYANDELVLDTSFAADALAKATAQRDELLAVLKRCRDVVDTGRVMCDPKRYDDPKEFEAMLAEIDAAIAKAKGKS